MTAGAGRGAPRTPARDVARLLAFERAEGDWAASERSVAGAEIARLFAELAERPGAGPALWGAVHGLVDLLIKGIVDVGQRELGASVIPSRGNTLMRGLLEGLAISSANP